MKKTFIAVLLLLPILVLINGCGSDDDPAPVYTGTEVRVLNASPDAPSLDVLIDEKTEWSDVPYEGGSAYCPVVEGQEKNLMVYASGETWSPLIEETISLEKDTPYSLIFVGFLDDIEALQITEDNTKPDSGHAKMRVVHASPTEKALDIYVTKPGEPLNLPQPTFPDMVFKEFSYSRQIDAGECQIRITRSGETDPIFDSGTVTVNSGWIFTAVIMDASGGVSPINLVALTDDSQNPVYPIPDERALVRLINASPDAPLLDVLFDNKEVISGVPPKQASDYKDVDEGENRNVKINNFESKGQTLFETTRSVESGESYTLLALNYVHDIDLRVLDDDAAAPPASYAKIRFIHASPDAPRLDMLIDNKVVKADMAFGEVSEYIKHWAGERNFKVNDAETNDTLIENYNIFPTPILEEKQVYTFVVVGEVDDNTIKAVLLSDN
jgi:hypothetical protein